MGPKFPAGGCTDSTTVCKLWRPSRTVGKIIMHGEFFSNPRGSEASQNGEHRGKTKDINTLTKACKRDDVTFL